MLKLDADAVLHIVRDAGGRLEPTEAGRIAFVGPESALTERLREGIKANRSELLDRLRHRTPAELVAAVADRGHWLVLRDGGLELRQHEGARPLPQDLLDRIDADKAAIAHFMLKPVKAYSAGERTAMGLSASFGLQWLEWCEERGYTPPEAR